jgi:hypothetical protein
MIHPLIDTIGSIQHYDDSLQLAMELTRIRDRALAGQDITVNDCAVLHAAVQNLQGMHDLLRSARHHLAVKALDAV